MSASNQNGSATEVAGSIDGDRDSDLEAVDRLIIVLDKLRGVEAALRNRRHHPEVEEAEGIGVIVAGIREEVDEALNLLER